MNEKQSKWALITLVVITLLCIIPLSKLRFEFNIEKLFPSGDDHLVFYQKFQDNFNTKQDDEYIFIALTNHQGIFQSDFLMKADSVARLVQSLPNIVKVYAPTSSYSMFFSGQEINARPLIHIREPEWYKQDSIYLFESEEFRDLLVSKDGKSLVIAAFNKEQLSDQQKDSVLSAIQGCIKDLKFDDAHLAAKIRVERVYVQEIEKNLKKYIVLSFLAIGLILFVLFKSLKAVVVPMLIIMVSVIWTFTLIALTNGTLDIISSLLPPILAAICMSDIIHISTHYMEKLRNGNPKELALKSSFREIGWATFYTCCTVAAGFVTLGITEVIPIRNFGLYAAAGILIGFFITIVLLYAYFLLSPVPNISGKVQNDHWTQFLSRCFMFILRKRYWVLATVAAAVLACGFLVKDLQINASLLDEIPKGHPILRDYNFLEDQFSGTRAFEMSLIVKQKDKTFHDAVLLRQIEPINQFLKDSCGVGNIISPLSLYKGANKAFNGGNHAFFRLPEKQSDAEYFRQAIMQTQYAEEMSHYISQDGKQLRISGRLPNISLKEAEVIQQRLKVFFRQNELDKIMDFQLTGSAVLLDRSTRLLTGNLITGILIDVLVISFISILLLRGWRIIGIMLLPNLIPLVFMAAIMVLMQVDLKADTSVIFAIALGIAVDDTVHFLSRLRLELKRGFSLVYAVKRTYLSTGKAIIITTWVLISGFGILLSSSFGGAFYIGLLISCCLFIAMLMELTLTPLLILLFYKKRS